MRSQHTPQTIHYELKSAMYSIPHSSRWVVDEIFQVSTLPWQQPYPSPFFAIRNLWYIYNVSVSFVMSLKIILVIDICYCFLTSTHNAYILLWLYTYYIYDNIIISKYWKYRVLYNNIIITIKRSFFCPFDLKDKTSSM